MKSLSCAICSFKMFATGWGHQDCNGVGWHTSVECCHNRGSDLVERHTDSLHKRLGGHPAYLTVYLRSTRTNGRSINGTWQYREHADAKLLRIRHFLRVAGKKPLHALGPGVAARERRAVNRRA